MRQKFVRLYKKKWFTTLKCNIVCMTQNNKINRRVRQHEGSILATHSLDKKFFLNR